MNCKLLNFYRLNARKGEFRAEANTIFIYDVLVASDADADWMGGVSAESFARTLAGMTGDITLRINSPGGDVTAGTSMAQAIRQYPGNVIAQVDGWAASSASLVAVAANKTVMAAGSLMMIHKAWTLEMGNADDFLKTASLLEMVDGQIAEAYAAKSGKNAAEFVKMMAGETWFTPKGAIEMGLADAELSSQADEKAMAKFDMSAFAHAPKIEAPAEDPPAQEESVTLINSIQQRVQDHRRRMLEKAA